MNNDNQSRADNMSYSPFWPLFIVFAVFLLMQALELKNRIDQREQMQAASAQFGTLAPKAQSIQQTLEKVGKDLIALSDGKTNEAAKIIAEFDIRINAPTPPPATK